jgi:hypothetical protein
LVGDLKEKEIGQKYAVDRWPFDQGENAAVVKVEDWYIKDLERGTPRGGRAKSPSSPPNSTLVWARSLRAPGGKSRHEQTTFFG